MSPPVIIILVEDDDGHALLVERNIKRSGFGNQIIRFKDGAEVLAFLFDGRFAVDPRQYLMLLDLHMPGVDGLTVLRRIKEDTHCKVMPVVILTTTEDPPEIQECYRLGCNLYLTKPVHYQDFVETVVKLGQFILMVQVPVTEPARTGDTPHAE